MNSSSLSNAYNYIQGAAKLRLRLEPWITDQEFTSNGGIIYYAVDTDVIKVFLNPNKDISYASVFIDDDRSTQEILVWALARFIFFRLVKDKSLLIIPPHQQEMDSIFMGIARDALYERLEISWPNIEKYFQEYAQTRDKDKLISFLRKEPIELIYFAYGGGRGFNAELSRITELLKKDRILNIERFIDYNNGTQWVIPILHDFDGKKSDYDDLKKSSKYWIEELHKTKSPMRSRLRIFDDAEVLARLELMNREMEENNRRLVLISGDSALHRAAANRYWNKGLSFADFFVRDPRIFMAAPNFLTIDNSNEYDSKKVRDLIGWLDVFLARYQPRQSGYNNRLRGIFRLNEQEGYELAQEFLINIPKLKNDWKEFIGLTAVEYGLNTESDNLKKFIEFIDLLTIADIKQVRETVEVKCTEVWNDFLNVAMRTGLSSTDALERKPGGILDISENLPLRGVPALNFTLEPVHTYVRELCRTLLHKDVIKQIMKLEKDLNKVDLSSYTATLFFALAFGAAGRWGVTRTLSEYALQIADHSAQNYAIPDGHEPITGNEAAYLLAWAIRHNIKFASQLLTAQKYLNEARARKVKATGDKSPDIRYDSESIAIQMTYYFFKTFKGEEILDEGLSLDQIQRQILKIVNSKRLSNGEDYIKFSVKKQLLVYLFCVLLLRIYKEKETDIEEEIKSILHFLPDFRNILESKEYNAVTCFTQPVFFAVPAYLERKRNKLSMLDIARKFLMMIISNVIINAL